MEAGRYLSTYQQHGMTSPTWPYLNDHPLKSNTPADSAHCPKRHNPNRNDKGRHCTEYINDSFRTIIAVELLAL